MAGVDRSDWYGIWADWGVTGEGCRAGVSGGGCGDGDWRMSEVTMCNHSGGN